MLQWYSALQCTSISNLDCSAPLYRKAARIPRAHAGAGCSSLLREWRARLHSRNSPVHSRALPNCRQSKTAAAYPRSKLRGIQGAAAWSWNQFKLIENYVEYACPLSPMQASGYCYKNKYIWTNQIRPDYVTTSSIITGMRQFIPSKKPNFTRFLDSASLVIG